MKRIPRLRNVWIAAAAIAAACLSGTFPISNSLFAHDEFTTAAVAESSNVAESSTVSEWLKTKTAELVEFYKELHAEPELSFLEVNTAKKLASELRAVGCEVTEEVGKRGVVGVLKNGDGPVVLVRTDMDALPVVEETGLPYASKVTTRDKSNAEVGVMHACGHDMHMTCLVGVAQFMSQNRNAWQGTIIFIGQPAEETGGGASAMLEDGLFTRFPRPNFGLALHMDPQMAAGKIGYRGGYALANVDSITITVRGRGGHGAYPHTTIDPVVQAAHLVVDLQSVISREKSPLEPAVITVGSIHGGTKHNIIGDRCVLQLTVRSYTDSVRKSLQEGIIRRANAAAMAANAPKPEIVIEEGTPALRNDEALVERLVPVLQAELGAENVVPVEPRMGGEDFSQYGLAGVPVFMFWLGAIDESRLSAIREAGNEPPSLHSPLFYPTPEPCVRTGVRAMVAQLCDLLPPRKAAATKSGQ